MKNAFEECRGRETWANGRDDDNEPFATAEPVTEGWLDRGSDEDDATDTVASDEEIALTATDTSEDGGGKFPREPTRMRARK